MNGYVRENLILDDGPQYHSVDPNVRPQGSSLSWPCRAKSGPGPWSLVGAIVIISVLTLAVLAVVYTVLKWKEDKLVERYSNRVCVPCSSLRQMCGDGLNSVKDKLLKSEAILEGKATGVCCSGNSEQEGWLRNAIKQDGFSGFSAPVHQNTTARNFRAAHVFLSTNNKEMNTPVANDDGTLQGWSNAGNCAFVWYGVGFDKTRFRILYSGLYLIYSNVAFKAKKRATPEGGIQTSNVVYGQRILRAHPRAPTDDEPGYYPDCLLEAFQQVTCTNENTAPCHVSQLSGLVRLQSEDEIFVGVPVSSRNDVIAYQQLTYFGLYHVSE